MAQTQSPPVRAWPRSPAADRNRGPILDVLRGWLPDSGAALEIAAGTGQHAAHFAGALPAWQWQPTEPDAEMLPAIAAHCAGVPNVLSPLQLDVLSTDWPVAMDAFDLVYCANMVHIAPWACCEALMRGAARHLRAGGVLVMYGPFRVPGEPLAPSNAAFDADLQARNPAWGLRDLAAVTAMAQAVDLMLTERVAMPANNLLLRFEAA